LLVWYKREREREKTNCLFILVSLFMPTTHKRKEKDEEFTSFAKFLVYLQPKNSRRPQNDFPINHRFLFF
jgi:hypothetical protein